MESWQYLIQQLQTPTGEINTSPATTVEDLYGAVIVKLKEGSDRIYIGKNSLEAGGNMIATTNASDVNHDELFLYKQPGKDVREPDLSQRNIEEVIPVLWDNGQIDIISHSTTEKNIRTYAALHINTVAGNRTLQMDLSDLIKLFHPTDSPSPLIEFVERGETAQSKFALILQNPENETQAFLLIIEDGQQVNSTDIRSPRSKAITTDILSTIIRKTDEVYGNRFTKILTNVRNRRDYNHAEDLVLKKLMELQAMAYYFDDAINQGFWGAEKRRFLAKINNKISLEVAKQQIIDPYQEYPTVPRNFEPGEEHLIYQAESDETAEQNKIIAVENAYIERVSGLLGPLSNEHTKHDVIEWIKSLDVLAEQTENLLTIQRIIETFDNYAINGGSRNIVIGASNRQKSVKEILQKKSRLLRLELITDFDMWADNVDFTLLDFSVHYPEKMRLQNEDAIVSARYIEKLYEIASGEDSDSELFMNVNDRLTMYRLTGKGKDLLTSFTLDGRKRKEKVSISSVAGEAIRALAQETI